MHNTEPTGLEPQTILNNWIAELKENPHYSEEGLQKNIHLEPTSKKLLSELLALVKNPQIEIIQKEKIEPILSLFHNLQKEQISHGFSIKDTALLIYALKTSLMTLNSDTLQDKEKEQLLQLENSLDILGILTFERYSAEKEQLISRQTAHIHYLEKINTAHNALALIGDSPAMKEVFKALDLILEKDITVLLQGESGTGKDVIATAIHKNSNRKSKPFIAINCGAIPKELIESELFGHVKGAFTGADDKKPGKFELADGGTLFLDEIGEMNLETQVKLLRALQNQEIDPVGGTKTIKVNVRIIAATNQPLKQLVDDKKFRLDLYYRLNVFPIYIPPLRERPEDILPLSHHFLDILSKRLKIPTPLLTEDAAQYLMQQRWEGNARELENTLHRGLIIAQGQPISREILTYQPGQKEQLLLNPPDKAPAPYMHPSLILPLDELEKKAIEHALELKKGNMLQVAKALGISRTTLYNKLEKYQIPLPN